MFYTVLPKYLTPVTSFKTFSAKLCTTRLYRQLQRVSAKEVEKVHRELTSALDQDSVSAAEIVCSQHGKDEGIDRNLPADLVVWPRSTEEVSIVARICTRHRIPMIPFGTGTGLESGVGAVKGGVSVNLTKMDRITNFNPEDFDATVEPGVTRKTLNHFLKDHGLWFPVDPGADASLCGMTATSASGTNAVRYGTMRENVMNVEVVLADGRSFFTAGKNRRTKKTSAGYNLTNLFVGSEGTLGFITKSTLKIYGLPETMVSAVCAFPSVKAAVDTCVQVLQSNIPIARIELMDDVAMDICNRFNQTDYDVQPTLFLEFHGTAESVDSQAQQVAELSQYNGGSTFRWARQVEERNRLWKARHDIYWTTLRSTPGCRVIITDVCVPITKLPDLIAQTKADILQAGVVAPILGHIGDGNFHALIQFNPDDTSSFIRAEELAKRLSERALMLDGTCTGEHGIGMGKIPYLEQEVGDIGIDIMKTVKNALDPLGLMNPGKILRMN